MTLIENFLAVLAQLAPFLLVGFFVAGLLHTFVPADVLARLLGRSGLGSITKAAALGVPLPLCSCGVIPVAVELRNRGASRGATASFLVATPETGVDSISASIAVMHPVMVIARPIAALLSAIAAGLAVEWGSREPKETGELVAESCCNKEAESASQGAEPPSSNRIRRSFVYGFGELFDEIGFYLLPALLVTAAMNTWLEPQVLSSWIEQAWLQMLALVVIGVPVYVCATGATPIAAALIASGFSPGAALVFLLVGPATNLVTISAAIKTLGKGGAFTYCLAVVVTGIACGLALDATFAWLSIRPEDAALDAADHATWLHWAATWVMGLLFVWHGWARFQKRFGS